MRTAVEPGRLVRVRLSLRPDRVRRFVAVVLACVPPLVVLVDALLTPGEWRLDLLNDDAHYYLGIARSLAAGEGSSFTGLTTTNGYHPLWLLCLVPLAALVRRPDHLVLAVLALQGVLWMGSVREALRIGRLVGCWPCAAAGLAAYSVLAAITGRLAFAGMESGLVLLLLLVAIRMIVTADRRVVAHLRLGVVLALVALARLDAVMVAVPLGALVLWSTWRRETGRARARAALALAGPGVALLGLYTVVSHVVFGTWMPVSGRAKGLGAPFLNLQPVRSFLEVGAAFGRPLWFGVVSLALAAAALAWRPWRVAGAVGRLATCVPAVLAGQAALLAYLVVGTSYDAWPWYQYMIPVYAFCAVVLLWRRLVERHGAGVARLGAVVLALATVAVQAAAIFRPEAPGYPGSIQAARFVRDSLPPDAVIAIGDRAGMFGVLGERRILHLEGLVADVAYLGELADGRAPDRLTAEGVDHYARYGPPGERVVVGGRACERFEEPGQSGGPRFPVVVCDDDLLFTSVEEGDPFRLWRYRPEIGAAGTTTRPVVDR